MDQIMFSKILKNEFELSILNAHPDDALSIINFLNKVGGETDYLTFGHNEFSISIEDEKNIIAECLATNINLMLIAKINNEIVGQLFLQRSNKSRIRHIAELGITVSKDYWGYGIGSYMIKIAIDWAIKQSISKIQLQVRTDNQRAVDLYKKLGFCIEGTIIRAIKINQIYFDEYIMGLTL